MKVLIVYVVLYACGAYAFVDMHALCDEVSDRCAEPRFASMCDAGGARAVGPPHNVLRLSFGKMVWLGWGNSFAPTVNVLALSDALGRRLELVYPGCDELADECAFTPVDYFMYADGTLWKRSNATADLYMDHTYVRRMMGFKWFDDYLALRHARNTTAADDVVRTHSYVFWKHVFSLPSTIEVVHIDVGAHAAMHRFFDMTVSPHMFKRALLHSFALQPWFEKRYAAMFPVKHQTAAHVRTMAADVDGPVGVAISTEYTLDILAWEHDVGVDEMRGAMQEACADGDGTLFVASDSNSVIRLFETVCEKTEIVSSGTSQRVGLFANRFNVNKEANCDAMLDWVALGRARHLYILGGGSSFSSSAHTLDVCTLNKRMIQPLKMYTPKLNRMSHRADRDASIAAGEGPGTLCDGISVGACYALLAPSYFSNKP